MTKQEALETLMVYLNLDADVESEYLEAQRVAIECIQHCIDEDDDPCYDCDHSHCRSCLYSGRIPE